MDELSGTTTVDERDPRRRIWMRLRNYMSKSPTTRMILLSIVTKQLRTSASSSASSATPNTRGNGSVRLESRLDNWHHQKAKEAAKIRHLDPCWRFVFDVLDYGAGMP